MRRGVRYRVAKLGKWAQRVTIQVGFGCVLIVASHWWLDPGEREWMRDVGALIVGAATAHWMRQQGSRRRHRRTGRLIRTPTVRISSDDADKIASYMETSDAKGD